MKIAIWALSLVAVCSLSASPAKAQVFDMGQLTASLSIDHVTQSERARADGASSEATSPISQQIASQLLAAPTPLAPQSATGFEFSEQRSQQILAQIVERTRQSNPASAGEMERLFASIDIIGEIGSGIAAFGLKTDNVADAYTVYWMSAWEAANGATTDFDFNRPQVQAVRQQAANALLASPAFVNASDAVKQEMSETYLVQAALIQASVDASRSDPDIAAGLAVAVRQGAAASGLDLDGMTLTNQGFVPTR